MNRLRESEPREACLKSSVSELFQVRIHIFLPLILSCLSPAVNLAKRPSKIIGFKDSRREYILRQQRVREDVTRLPAAAFLARKLHGFFATFFFRAAVRFFASSTLSESLEQARENPAIINRVFPFYPQTIYNILSDRRYRIRNL